MVAETGGKGQGDVNMVVLVNLTPHEITVYDESGKVKLRIPPSGKVARVTVKQEKVGEINGIPVVSSVVESIEGLPEPDFLFSFP